MRRTLTLVVALVSMVVSLAGPLRAQESLTAATEGPPQGMALLEVPLEQFFIVAGEQGRIRVLQRTVIQNVGPWAAERIHVPIPESARLIEPPDGWGDVSPGESGLVDFRGLPPQEVREYRVLYEIMAGSRPAPLRRALPYPVREMGFWVEHPAFSLTGLNVFEAGEEMLGGESFRVYGMGPANPHPAWQVVIRPQVRPLPDLSAQGDRHGDPLAALSGWMDRGRWMLLVGFVLVGGWLWRRRGAAAGPSASERALQAEIVRLDVAYGAGDLDDATYRERRQRLLDRLLSVDQSTTGQGATGEKRWS